MNTTPNLSAKAGQLHLFSGTVVVAPLFEMALRTRQASAAEDSALSASARITDTVIVGHKQIGTVEFPTPGGSVTSTTLVVSRELHTGNTLVVRYLPDDPTQVWAAGSTPPSAMAWRTGPLIPIGVLGVIASAKKLKASAE